MEQISGLVWKTERPLWDAIRYSPKFLLLGNEWNFSLTLYWNFDKPAYKIELCASADRRSLGSSSPSVEVYISNDCRIASMHGISKTFVAGMTVWECSVNDANNVLGSEIHYRKLIITFIFHSRTLHMLNLRTYETELQLKAILSEDKCMQACSDIPPDLETLSSDFRQLLGREIFPDVKLRCGDRDISAHRSILAARSDVFTAMFRNKMAESETGTVDVTDVDSEVLDLLLQYVYAGKIQDLSDDTAASLYAASDKYLIHGLKKSCSDWMVRNLTVENCLGYLTVANAHSDEDLTKRVVDFAAKNLESIKKDDWFEFNKDHSELANSVYQRRLAPALSKQT